MKSWKDGRTQPAHNEWQRSDQAGELEPEHFKNETVNDRQNAAGYAFRAVRTTSDRFPCNNLFLRSPVRLPLWHIDSRCNPQTTRLSTKAEAVGYTEESTLTSRAFSLKWKLKWPSQVQQLPDGVHGVECVAQPTTTAIPQQAPSDH